MSNRRLVGSGVVLLAGVMALVPMAVAAPKVKLTKSAAQKIAQDKEAGTVKSGELEHEKGRWIYSFDIVRDGQTHEVGVDANTGEIVEDVVESAADETKEKAEDAAKASKMTPKQ